MTDNEDVDGGGESGSGKGLLVVGLVLGLPLGGGAAWFMLSGGDDTGSTVIVDEIPKMDVNIEGVRMPVFDQRGRYSGTVKIRVAVTVNGGQDLALATGFSSQLKHEFLTALSGLEAPTGEGQTLHSPDEIAAVLLPAAQKVLGDIKVHAVLVNDLEFQQR